MENNQPRPKNHLVMAIVTTVLPLISCTFFGLLPGIVSIVFASQVNKKHANGDYEGAKNASKYAKIAWIIALVIFLVQIAFVVYTIMVNGGDFMDAFNQEIERQKALQNQ